mmetsp:Transcript_35005/g.6302  ORF Transcript_35005/g.6302 Transcript_35005/m.6302 type:complete len:89 (+) Transcript_35005:1583-1849(+)
MYDNWYLAKYAEGTGAFALCIVPLNAVFLPFIPFYFCKGLNKKYLDLALCYYSYMLLLIMAITLYFVVSLLAVIPIWIYLFYYIFRHS